MTDTAIRLEGLTREFETSTGKIRAVDGLSLEVPAGTIFGFLGPNGAGKTTTIRLLLGLLEPTDGSAQVLGFDTQSNGAAIRERTGALLEHTGVYEQMTALDNLEFYGRIWRLPNDERQARIEELMRQLGLWERRGDKAGKWSEGMKQKLALARALLHRPELVLLDEPTAGLDVPSAAAVRDELSALASREGVTIFLTTHNMAEAERLCNCVAVIRQGRLVTIGHPDTLRAQTGGSRVEVFGRGFTEERLSAIRARAEVASAAANNGHVSIDLAGDAEVAPLIGMLVTLGAEVEEVRRGKASLEEVFMTLMEEER